MRLGLRWVRLWPAVVFGLAGVLVPAAWFGAVIATVALMLFAPMFATVVKWTEPGWTSVVGLSILVLWFAFIAVWWVLAAVGAVVGWLLYRRAGTVRGE